MFPQILKNSINEKSFDYRSKSKMSLNAFVLFYSVFSALCRHQSEFLTGVIIFRNEVIKTGLHYQLGHLLFLFSLTSKLMTGFFLTRLIIEIIAFWLPRASSFNIQLVTRLLRVHAIAVILFKHYTWKFRTENDQTVYHLIIRKHPQRNYLKNIFFLIYILLCDWLFYKSY